MNKQYKLEAKKKPRPVSKRSQAGKPIKKAATERDSLSRRLLGIEENERKRIRRELLETIGQSLAVLKLSLHRIKRSLANEIQSAYIETDAIADHAIERLRLVSDTLMPGALDDFGLLKALEDLFWRYTDSTHIKVNFKSDGLERRMPIEIEATIYRIIRETLLNIVSQGEVSQVDVSARVTDNMVSLTIAMTGNGLEASCNVSGPAVVRERVLLLGGNLFVETLPSMVRLSSQLPIAANGHPSDEARGRRSLHEPEQHIGDKFKRHRK